MKRYQCELANTCGYRGSFYEPISEYKYKIQQDCLLQGQAQIDQRVILLFHPMVKVKEKIFFRFLVRLVTRLAWARSRPLPVNCKIQK